MSWDWDVRMSWDWDDVVYGCMSADPLTRHNAHQAAKGRSPLPDPDLVRKAARESVWVNPAEDDEAGQ